MKLQIVNHHDMYAYYMIKTLIWGKIGQMYRVVLRLDLRTEGAKGCWGYIIMTCEHGGPSVLGIRQCVHACGPTDSILSVAWLISNCAGA